MRRMKLEKPPETPNEYYETIEAASALGYRLERDLKRGAVEDPEGKVAAEISELRTITKRLIAEACEKFHLVHPSQCPETPDGEFNDRVKPPAGKTYYWVWQEAMRIAARRREYQGLICSACPYSKGVKRFIRFGKIPCKAYQGVVRRLKAPDRCVLVDSKTTEQDFVERIAAEHGQSARKKFEDRLASIRARSTET
jgi:hypothetical protein